MQKSDTGDMLETKSGNHKTLKA
ncbi:hypothetical protein [Pseudomonas moorei]